MSDTGEIQQVRVSVSTYNRVMFPHPDSGIEMLALERQAAATDNRHVHVRSQPFGGGIHILNPIRLQEIIGEIRFDSERSKHERDFRILIPPSKWELIKEYCLHHLEDEEDLELETEPDRELTEEFMETINAKLNPGQYTVRPLGFVIDSSPVRSRNIYARGQLTLHLYRIFEVRIVDGTLCRLMQTIDQLYTDRDLEARALHDFENYGKGRINTILTLPLKEVMETYLGLPPETRFQKVVIDGHELDESVLAILKDVAVPQYQRV